MSETASQAPRETAAGVLGIAVGLLLLIGGAFALFNQKPLQAQLDPKLAWANRFQIPEAWPEGLEPTAAAKLANGDGWVRLGGANESVPPTGDASEEDAPQESRKSGGDEDSSGEWEKVDWVAVEALDVESGPNEAFLVTKPRKRAASLRDEYFRNLPRRGVDDLESKGGGVVIETGEVLWRGYEANTVHERRYFKDDDEPTFRDSIRVNLSLNEPCVLIALWPQRAAARIGAMQPLLDVFVPAE